MDPDALWEQARILVDERGDDAGPYVTRRIDAERERDNAEALAFWQAVAWRIAEMRRRARRTRTAEGEG